MRSLWSEQRKLEIWLEIEILACEAMAEFGSIPRADAVTIREKATFDLGSVQEIEKRTNHDVIAFSRMSLRGSARPRAGSTRG
jgi:adenylosuccinate lyase